MAQTSSDMCHGAEDASPCSLLRPQAPSAKLKGLGEGFLAGPAGVWGHHVLHRALQKFLAAAFNSLSSSGCVTLILRCPHSWAA